MAVKVVEIELTQPLPDLQEVDIGQYSHLQLLVRQQCQPIGYAWVPLGAPDCLSESHLRHCISQQLADAQHRVAVDGRLRGSPYFIQPMVTWPTITVAVCTRQRPDSLARTLASLVRLDYPADKLDLLVVDNAPQDEATAQVVAHFPQVRYVVAPCPGLDRARNRAIAAALGDIVAFTDDDVIVDPLWLQAIAPHFMNTAVMAVTGLVVPAERETPAQNWFEDYGGFGRGFEMRYYTMGTRKEWGYWPLGAGIFGTGCNMAYRQTLFEQIGGFDPALDVGTPAQGCGDHDMFYRTLCAGYILVYEPGAMVWHYHRHGLPQLQRQLNDFGRGVYAFWAKTFLDDRVMRWRVLRFALIWYWLWFVKRFFRPGRLPRRLVWAEAAGALAGPWSYFKSRRQAKQLVE